MALILSILKKGSGIHGEVWQFRLKGDSRLLKMVIKTIKSHANQPISHGKAVSQINEQDFGLLTLEVVRRKSVKLDNSHLANSSSNYFESVTKWSPNQHLLRAEIYLKQLLEICAEVCTKSFPDAKSLRHQEIRLPNCFDTVNYRLFGATSRRVRKTCSNWQ